MILSTFMEDHICNFIPSLCQPVCLNEKRLWLKNDMLYHKAINF